MGKSLFLFVAFVALLSSCAATVSRNHAYGTVTIAFGDGSSRAHTPSGASLLETGWPGGAPPAFSSVTVVVSASDMSPVTAVAAGSSGGITIQVPAGSGRQVQVTAVPASGGSAPYFAKSYAGSETVDVGEGETKQVAIKLALSATKIALLTPQTKAFNYYLAAADSLDGSRASGTAVSIDYLSDVEFDDYGRLFVSADNWGIQRFPSLVLPYETVIPEYPSLIGGLAYQKSTGYLFFTYTNDQNTRALGYVHPASGIWRDLAIPRSLQDLDGAIAADAASVYVETKNKIVRLVIDTVDSVSAGVSVTFASLGLAGLEVQDLLAQNGVLYVAASTPMSELVSSEARALEATEQANTAGKIIALNAETLSYLWEIDWPAAVSPSADDQSITLYFGPLRFLGFAPGKLYVAEAGVIMASGEGGPMPAGFLGRVVEIDTIEHNLSGTGLESIVMPIEWFIGNREITPALKAKR